MKFIRECLLKILLFLYKEETTMAVVYATLIIKGLKTIDDVPSIIREQVREYLEALEIPMPSDEETDI